MKKVSLLLAIVAFFIPSSLQECLLQSHKGIPSYVCDSLQELEEKENPFAYNVVIYSNKTIPTTTTPNVKVVLLQEIDSGASPAVMRILKEFSTLFKGNTEVATLPARVISGLPIQELTLEHNGISEIQQGALANLTKLKSLRIMNNRLTTIKKNVFNNLPTEVLSLSFNRLMFIEKEALTNLYNLKYLFLDNNRLTEFEPEILMNYPQKLEVLWLKSNSFSEIDRNTVRGLNNLRELRLDDNKISQISRYTFENLANLKTLILSYNRILEVNPEIFPSTGLHKLEKLYLNDNRLSYLTTSVLERLKNLQYIRIGGNPWQCPCFDAILTWLGDHGVHQNCDKDYYSGTRPVCVVHDAHPNNCDYSNDNFYFQRYNEINSKAPKDPDCDL